MIPAFYLLALVGLFGSYDVLYWHWYRLRLFQTQAALWENVTHAIRAYLFAGITLLVLHVDAHGWWWLFYPAILASEFINTMSDVVLETKSRSNLGGLPAHEYIVHVFLSILTGAALASILWATNDFFGDASAFHLRTLDVPLPARIGSYVSVFVAVGMGSFEMINVLRMSKERHKVEAPVS